MEWQKLTTSGSNTHLEALHLLGATSTVSVVSNSVYYPDDQFFRLHNFEGSNELDENTFWKGNNANSNASGGSWISIDRTVNGVEHKRFDVSGYSQNGNPQSNTGPESGITPTFLELNPGLSGTGNAIDQTPNTLYLYTETSDVGENTYSITSPLINLTDYSNTKLVFYFYLFGQNVGNFKVFTSTSPFSLLPNQDNAIQQNISPAILNEEFGIFFISDPVSQVGYQGAQLPGQTHTDNSSEWYRAEVNLTSFTEGYVWIVYEAGGPNGVSTSDLDQADFAISNVFLANPNNTTLDSDSYLIPETEEIDNYELSLKVLGDAIKIYGLPEEDPHEEGQLYQDPDFINANQGFILISNG